jgi:hypothetical protein
MHEKIKVLYIAGSGRNGSTLLARLFGQLDGFVNIGEALRYLFNAKMLARDIRCGCGDKIGECYFWKDIAATIDDSVRMTGASYVRLPFFPFLISPFKSRAVMAELETLSAATQEFLCKLADRDNCNVIVDASKNPATAYILSQIEGVEVYLVHLIRDPRGVVSSWAKPKDYLERHPAATVILWWVGYNLASEFLRRFVKRYWLVRYEDFVRAPQEFLKEIAGEISPSVPDIDYMQGKHAFTEPQHAIAGNPDKFAQGVVKIEERKWSLPWHVQTFVWVLTFPLLYRYHYAGGKRTL